MTWPDPKPNPLPGPPGACPQCGETKCTGDQRWQHERDYRGSEDTWRRLYAGPSVMWRGGRVEVTR